MQPSSVKILRRKRRCSRNSAERQLGQTATPPRQLGHSLQDTRPRAEGCLAPHFFFLNLEKFTAETTLSGKFNFLSVAERNDQFTTFVLYISSICKMSVQNNVKKSGKKSGQPEPEVIDLTQIDLVDLTEEKSENGGDSTDVTHISETQMVVEVDSDDTLSYKPDSSSKSGNFTRILHYFYITFQRKHFYIVKKLQILIVINTRLRVM